MRKVIATVVICLFALWGVRIVLINQNPPVTDYYNIGDKVELKGTEISFCESRLEDPEEFKARTGIDYDNGDEGVCKLISVCFEVTNKSGKDIEWDTLMDWFDGGFVSPECWCTISEPQIMQELNMFRGERFSTGAKQKIWFAAIVNKKCFKEKEWERINEREFLYILYCFTNRTAVRLRS